MSSKNRTRRTTTRNIRFPNHMIEQINSALEHKGSEPPRKSWRLNFLRKR
ncbi:YlcI/YnfO family protein [Escherichia coli]